MPQHSRLKTQHSQEIQGDDIRIAVLRHCQHFSIKHSPSTEEAALSWVVTVLLPGGLFV